MGTCFCPVLKYHKIAMDINILNRYFNKRQTSYKVLRWKTAILIFLCAMIMMLLSIYSPYSPHFTLKDALIGLFAGGIVLFVNYLFFYLKRHFKKNKKSNSDYSKTSISFTFILDSLFSSLFIKIIIIIILASIEEFIFRGFILSFTNAHTPIIISVLINGIFFYLIHFNSKVFELIFMGVVFSFITIYTDNILPAVVAHASNNLLVYFIRRVRLANNNKTIKIIK